MATPTKELLDEMNGCEVWSLEFEGCVGIEDGLILVDGKQIKPTNKQVRTLWSEHIENELSDYDYYVG